MAIHVFASVMGYVSILSTLPKVTSTAPSARVIPWQRTRHSLELQL